MKDIKTSAALFNELKKLIDLPEDAVKLVLTLEIDTIAKLELTTEAKDGTGDEIENRFDLKEIDND